MDRAPAAALETARAWILAAQARDVDRVLAHAVDLGGVHTFASGPDTNLTLDELVAHLRAHPPVPMDAVEVEGRCRGDVAWVFGTAQVRLPEGPRSRCGSAPCSSTKGLEGRAPAPLRGRRARGLEV
ncbi:hypothetical protein ACFQV8_20090 [Pseudonocardia benzenivorans]